MPMSPVIFEKLRINRISYDEMLRRKREMPLIAEADGLFIPAVKEISPGRWLDKGVVLGKIISGQNQIYAYALDKEVNRIRTGDSAVIKLRGELKGTRGTVIEVNPVAVKFRDSTLVRELGGLIPCYPKPQNREFQPVNVLYCVTIRPEQPLPPRIRTPSPYTSTMTPCRMIRSASSTLR